MRGAIFGLVFLVIVANLISGCGGRPDTDVTSSPKYNFQSFAGTAWQTKIKTALGEIKTYKGEHIVTLLTPKAFDPKHPEYDRPPHLEKIITELPAGTRIRIERLLQDNGSWGGVRVTALLDDGKSIYLSNFLIAKNTFISNAWSDSKEWGVNPDMLEQAK